LHEGLEREAAAKLAADGRKRATIEIYAREPDAGYTLIVVNGQALRGVQSFTLSADVEGGLVELTLRVLPENLRFIGQVLAKVE
jgi:hypothetical protein